MIIFIITNNVKELTIMIDNNRNNYNFIMMLKITPLIIE